MPELKRYLQTISCPITTCPPLPSVPVSSRPLSAETVHRAAPKYDVPYKSENAAKQPLGKKSQKTLPTEKPRIVSESEYREALLACAILSKLETRKRIVRADVLRFVQILKTRKAQNGGSIILDVGAASKDRTRVSLKLPAASVTNLLLVTKDNPNQLEVQFARVCTYLNNPALESQLLNLGKKNILIQSSQISSNLPNADLTIKGNTIVFA